MLAAVERARGRPARRVIAGGERLDGPGHDGGFYVAPTVVEDVAPDAELSCTELFGPITTLHRVADFEEALARGEHEPVRADGGDLDGEHPPRPEFVARVVAGGVRSTARPTAASRTCRSAAQRDSGNGWREPGTEALDVYSDWKTVYVKHDPGAV